MYFLNYSFTPQKAKNVGGDAISLITGETVPNHTMFEVAPWDVVILKY